MYYDWFVVYLGRENFYKVAMIIFVNATTFFIIVFMHRKGHLR